MVFQQLLRWAESGVCGGVVLGSGCDQGQASDEGLVVRLRALLLFVVAQAASDASESILEGFTKASRDERSRSVGVGDPYQLALWALRETAARIASPVIDKVKGEPIFFACDRFPLKEKLKLVSRPGRVLRRVITSRRLHLTKPVWGALRWDPQG